MDNTAGFEYLRDPETGRRSVSGAFWMAKPDEVIVAKNADEAVELISEEMYNTLDGFNDGFRYNGNTVIVKAGEVSDVITGLTGNGFCSGYAVFPYSDGVVVNPKPENALMAFKVFAYDMTYPAKMGVAVSEEI